MPFSEAYRNKPLFLMEGALGERLKREHGLVYDADVDMAGFVYDAVAREALRCLWTEYMAIAARNDLPALIMTPTRRANRERVRRSVFCGDVIADNVLAAREARDGHHGGTAYVGGTMGCKGDAYRATEILSAAEAEAFHSWSAERFAEAGADFLYAALMPVTSEAAGLARACSDTHVPYIISFTIRRNGKLADGTPIHDAIARVDTAAANPPLCYMVNCVHPQILSEALAQPFNRTGLVRERLRGIQANASPLSPEELDQSPDLHDSEPGELAEEIAMLRNAVDLKIAGGCCGTDGRHIAAIAERLLRGNGA